MPAESGPEDAFVRHPLRLVGVATLFAACGALSEPLAGVFHWLGGLARGLPYLNPWLAIGLPFAPLSAALFLRSWKAIFSVVLNVAVWQGASSLAECISNWIGPGGDRSFIPYALAGAAGALGVALVDSIACRRLLSVQCLATVTMLGALSVLAACDPLGLFGRSDDWPLGYGIPVIMATWQACVGTYLYWDCVERRPAA